MLTGIEAGDKNRVVVTGLGIISPLGNNVQETWERLIRGESGIGRISEALGGAVNSEVDIAGLVMGFDPTKYLPRQALKGVHRSAAFSTVAAMEALYSAGLLDNHYFVGNNPPSLINVDPRRIGARIGTGVGGGGEIAEMEDIIREKGDTRISPRSMLTLLSERVATVPSILLGLKGPISSVVAACATGSIAIGDAVDKIRLGYADVMVAGGTEAVIHRVAAGGFNAMRALSRDNDNPTFASRPFNKDVNGFVMAEGVGILILESLEHAKQRGAEGKILAEIVGHADTADAYDDTNPSGLGAEEAMRLALIRAGIEPSEVDYINAHGTSTPNGDKTELEAIMRVFGDRETLLISSTKSATGHLLGAAGAIEAGFCVLAIRDGIVPPTLNLHDPIIIGLDLVANKARKVNVRVVMSNSFGFGGLNSVLLFRRF